jgi:hypothetical protein
LERLARCAGGEFFHEFEYEDWEEVDVNRPVPIWICFFLVFSYICMGRSANMSICGLHLLG